jgi:hypothetical protein
MSGIPQKVKIATSSASIFLWACHPQATKSHPNEPPLAAIARLEAAGGQFFFDLGNDAEKGNFERKFKDPDGTPSASDNPRFLCWLTLPADGRPSIS